MVFEASCCLMTDFECLISRFSQFLLLELLIFTRCCSCRLLLRTKLHNLHHQFVSVIFSCYLAIYFLFIYEDRLFHSSIEKKYQAGSLRDHSEN